jgi:hypothetical protein
VVQDPETIWHMLTLDWYGEGTRTLESWTGTLAQAVLPCLSVGLSRVIQPARVPHSALFHRSDPDSRADHPGWSDARESGRDR